MKFLLLCSLLLSLSARGEMSSAELTKIGHKVWQNECAGTLKGLTSWNAGEDFASLGIGHFIWYPAGKRGPFDESFPKLMRFLAARSVKTEAWMMGPCPWNSRTEFLRGFGSDQMSFLRKFLADTIPAQTAFLVERMEESLPKMLAEADPSKREKVQREFERLKQTPRGVFALIDYTNFKGEGTLATERYKGAGWGLLQVLETMNGGDVRAFSDAAKKVLARRVQNSPPARHEERWLAGWKNRVESYATGS